MRGAIWSAGDSGFQPSINLNAQGTVTLRIPPGLYHMCAIPATAAGILRPDSGFREALEGRCPAVEVSDDRRTSIQMPFVPVGEVKRLIDGLDAGDPPAPAGLH
jgi:hypothetical protein